LNQLNIWWAGFLAITLIGCESDPHDSETSTPTIPQTAFRKPVEPNGTVSVTIKRVNIGNRRLADMNDRGDMLFLRSKRGAKIREYEHEFQGKSIEVRTVEEKIGLNLCPDGLLMPTIFDPICELNSPVEFPFGNDLNAPKCYANDNILIARRKHDVITKKDCYVLAKDSQSEISASLVDPSGRTSIITSVKNITSISSRQATVFSQNSKTEPVSGGGALAGSSTIISKPGPDLYQSQYPITTLEKSDVDVIWVREQLGNNMTGSDHLVRIEGTKHQEVPGPPGFSNVMRVSSTGSQVAATFGNIEKGQPVRSFLQIGTAWKELAIPKGFNFSFVQKVFLDGTILGFVTSANGKAIRQVVWRGESVTILNDLPNWPKQGLMTMIVLANRRGDIYVRSVLNTETNMSDFYLLHLSIGP
jgi:predicted outer membrane repeat protein